MVTNNEDRPTDKAVSRVGLRDFLMVGQASRLLKGHRLIGINLELLYSHFNFL